MSDTKVEKKPYYVQTTYYGSVRMPELMDKVFTDPSGEIMVRIQISKTEGYDTDISVTPTVKTRQYTTIRGNLRKQIEDKVLADIKRNKLIKGIK